jgi:PIN domain nuclease of toxin-antitoxin system
LNGYLLDTGVALLAVDTPEDLSAPVRAALEQGPAFLSVIAYWEVMIKAMKGTLDVGDPRQWWSETLAALALQPLSYRPEHIAALYDLPPLHQDPFDRALIAQATVEDLTLLTTDTLIPQYASGRFRVRG